MRSSATRDGADAISSARVSGLRSKMRSVWPMVWRARWSTYRQESGSAALSRRICKGSLGSAARTAFGSGKAELEGIV